MIFVLEFWIFVLFYIIKSHFLGFVLWPWKPCVGPEIKIAISARGNYSRKPILLFIHTFIQGFPKDARFKKYHKVDIFHYFTFHTITALIVSMFQFWKTVDLLGNPVCARIYVYPYTYRVFKKNLVFLSTNVQYFSTSPSTKRIDFTLKFRGATLGGGGALGARARLHFILCLITCLYRGAKNFILWLRSCIIPSFLL